MERSLDSIVEEIAQNDEMAREFAAMDEIDEIYQYCKDAGLDCSEEEFDNEISGIISDFEYDDARLPEYALGYVAGGRNDNLVIEQSDKWRKANKSLEDIGSGRRVTVGSILFSALIKKQ